jgi:hypothetical protein
MRVFGFTFPVLLLLLIAFVIGGKNPGLVARIPLIGG